MSKAFDVVVIGGGPGGYIAAIRAAQLGLQTACMDDWSTAEGKPAPGGTCTNVGCIPSKALLQSSENYEHAGHAFAEHGIQVKGLALDLAQMLKRKDKVVRQNNDGIVYLFRKNKVTFFHGRGSLRRRRRRAAGRSRWRARGDGRNADGEARHRRHGLQPARRLPRASVAFDNKLDARQRRRARDSRGAEAAGRDRRRRDRAGDGQRLAAARRRGDDAGNAATRFCRPRTRRSRRRRGRSSPGPGPQHRARRQDRPGDGRQEGRDGRVRRQGRRRAEARVRPADRVDRPRAEHRGAERGEGRLSSSTRAASSRSTATAAPTCPTCGRSATWCAAPCSRTRPRRRASRSRERIAGRHGHVDFNTVPWVIYTAPGDRVGGQDRAAAEERRRRVPRRAVPVHGQRPRAGAGRHPRLREISRRRGDRPHPGRAHHRADGLRDDRRGGRRHGVPRRVRGHRAHLPRPPVALGGDEGSGARGAQAHSEFCERERQLIRTGPRQARSAQDSARLSRPGALRGSAGEERVRARRAPVPGACERLQRLYEEWSEYKIAGATRCCA